MNSKEALKKINQYWADMNVLGKSDIVLSNEDWDEVYKDLDRLKKLKKVIDFLKLNFNISLDSKLRISDDSECVQTFITYLPENTTIDEMFELLKEVLENE